MDPDCTVPLRYPDTESADDRQSAHVYVSWMRAFGPGWCATMSEIVNRPPGRMTRYISRNTLALSGARLITQLDMMRSMLPSSTGRFSAWPLRNSTFGAG